MARAPGGIPDAIVNYLSGLKGQEASIVDIRAGVSGKLGDVPASSIRSYLNLNVSDIFERTGRGRYRLKKSPLNGHKVAIETNCTASSIGSG